MDPSLGKNRAGIVEDQFLYEQASFPECHGATIVELKNGDLVASFFGGTKERNPDCCIWVCRKPKGATEWSAPYLAADGVFSLDDPQAVWRALQQNPLRRMPAPWLLRLKGISPGHAARLVGILCFSKYPAEI